MDSPPQEKENFLTYYAQTKQRIDLNIDMNLEKVVGQTKLTFILNKEIIQQFPENLFLYLNAENMFINNIKMQINDELLEEKKINNQYNNLIELQFTNSSPYYLYKNYLDQLYGNIEELESFKNINRVEWEIRQKGNLIIRIPNKLIISKKRNIKKENDSIIKNNMKIIQKMKIIINYELIEKNIGIIFQEFYETKIDNYYKICYTPNFYYNTQSWVPCIYNLSLQINWSLYIYITNEYTCYSSFLLNKILKDVDGKKLMISKTKEPTTARNIGFIIINDKILKSYYDDNNQNFTIIANENNKEKIEKYLINNKLIGTLYNY